MMRCSYNNLYKDNHIFDIRHLNNSKKFHLGVIRHILYNKLSAINNAPSVENSLLIIIFGVIRHILYNYLFATNNALSVENSLLIIIFGIKYSSR